MRVTELEIRFLRIVSESHLRLHPRLNLVVGPNASGKTTVLEALWVLGALNSFRSRQPEDLVQRGREGYRVSGVLEEGGVARRLTVERRREVTNVVLGGERLERASQLATAVPLVLLAPDSQRLLSGGPRERRRLLDWALFHVKPDYLAAWRAFHDALKQRNAALRRGKAALEAWNSVVAQRGMAVDNARRDCLQALRDVLADSVPNLLPEPLELRYQQGWPEGKAYEQVLQEGMAADCEMGYTRHGPHKAEIGFTVQQQPAQRVLSRGQSKVVAACLMLAQACYIQSRTGRQPVLLIDDLASELDRPTRARLMDMVDRSGMQAVVTALESTDLPWSEGAVFHVEHGRIEEGQL